MDSHAPRRSNSAAAPTTSGRRSALRWLVELATSPWRRKVLAAQVASRVGLVAHGTSARPMREYLGLRWAWDREQRRNVAHCGFCWQEGRERAVEVAESEDLKVVSLTCSDPGHGPGGLRLVRDSGGFRWGEVELDCRRTGGGPFRGNRARSSDPARQGDLSAPGGLGLPPPPTP